VTVLYLDDLAPGQKYGSGRLRAEEQVESEFKPAGGIVGAGFDEFRWPAPVRPGDELHLEIEILEVRASKSRPTQGIVKVRTTTRNQKGEPVQVSVGNLIVPRRPA